MACESDSEEGSVCKNVPQHNWYRARVFGALVELMLANGLVICS